MKKQFLSLSILISPFILLGFAGYINTLTQKPELNISKQQSAINLNQDLTEIFSIGQKRLLTDLIWISTLLESDIDHYKNNDLNSWLYLRFNTISTLDPRFKKNYQFGGQYLSIIKDDLSGAEELMLKGLTYYPRDYFLNFNLGFLYSIEMDEYKRAIPYLEEALKHDKAPKNLETLLYKIKFMAERNLNNTFSMLEGILSTSNDELIQEKVRSDLYSIKAEIDLDCLNNKKENCSNRDYFGNLYIFENGKYKTLKPFNKYQLHKRRDS